MSESLGTMISRSLDLGMGYTERLLKHVTPETFARFATVGGTQVVSNHPAFILGHLSLYGPRMVEQLGGDASGLVTPESFQNVFSKDATCEDDPEGTIYPDMDLVTQHYFDGYAAAKAALLSASDEIFQSPNPNEGRIKEVFPTLGAMHMFYVSGHIMMHLGQFSAWRRMQGLPAA